MIFCFLQPYLQYAFPSGIENFLLSKASVTKSHLSEADVQTKSEVEQGTLNSLNLLKFLCLQNFIVCVIFKLSQEFVF